MQRDPDRELVRRCHQHGADSAHARQIVGAGAPSVHRQGQGVQAGAGQQVPVDLQAVRLDGDRPHPPGGEHLRRQHQTVVETGADDDPPGVRVHASGPGQVVRDRGTQLHPAEGSPQLNELCGASVRARRAAVSHCLRGNVEWSGEPGIRLYNRWALGGLGGRARGRGGAWLGTTGHPGPGTLPRGEPALGDQLCIGVGDGVAGDAQIGGE